MKDSSFYDFDSFLNFGNKFNDAYKKNDNEDASFHRNRNPEKLHKAIRLERQENIRRLATTSKSRQMSLQLKDITEKPNTDDWSQFDRFNSYLDHGKKSINDDWYPWKSMKTKKEVPNYKEHLDTTTKAAKKQLPTLNGLDRSRVEKICSTTRLSDVRNLCKEYSLKKDKQNPNVKNQKKPKKKVMKERRPKIPRTPERKKSSHHLFFEPNSFRRRKGHMSLFDSLKSLIMTPSKMFQQNVRKKHRKSFSTNWLQDAVKGSIYRFKKQKSKKSYI